MDSEGFLDQLRARAEGQASQAEPEKGPLAEKCPLTWQVLCQSTYGAGKARETGSLTIFPDGGVFVAILHARAEGQKVYAESTTFEGILPAIEEKIKTDPNAFRETPDARRKRLSGKPKGPEGAPKGKD